MFNIECYNRYKCGHFSWECRSASNDKEDKVNLVGDEEDEEEPTLLLALNDEEKDDKSSWQLDNGASNHMCGYKEKFVEIDEKVGGNVFVWRLFKNPNSREMYNSNFL